MNRLTRRSFLSRLGATAGAGLVLPVWLAGCGDDDDEPSGNASGGGRGDALRVENWPAYIDEETVALFKEETGIDLRYAESLNDNNEWFARVQADLSAGRDIGADIAVPSSWLASRLIQLDWVQELPLDEIPNASNVVADLRNPTWDPGGRFTLPWQSGMTGIAYNIAETGRELTSVEDLFDPAFSGRIGMLTEMRDTVGLLLLGSGVDPEDATIDNAEAAFTRLEEAADSGQIRQFTGNDYMDDLASGNFAACVGWSGDISQLALDDPDLRFAIPEEGGMRWSDTMVIPSGATNLESAARWMNYVYDPVNAARIVAYVGYNSPVEGVREELLKDPETAPLAESPLMFPDDETLSRLHVFAELDEDQEGQFEERFSAITGA